MTRVINPPEHFKTGIRILMRIHRTKDGAVGNADRHAKKVVTRGEADYDIQLSRLLRDILPEEHIYSTVDARDLKKAMRTFKQLQLDNEYTPDPENFYLDIHNRWVSSLQQPSARATSLFLFDCDDVQTYEDLRDALYKIDDPSVSTVHSYLTKNGGHVITSPFAYPKLLDSRFHPLIHKNAMLLVAFSETPDSIVDNRVDGSSSA